MTISTPSPLFHGCAFKLARAREHVQTLKDEIDVWSERNPYHITRQHNADFTVYEFVFRINEPMPLVRWSLILADCISNLRAALDYFVYAAAIHQSGIDPPPEHARLMFPIADTPELFREQGRRIRTLSDGMRAAIERVQPYNRVHTSQLALLSIIRELNDRDKHRLLQIVFASPLEQGTHIWFARGQGRPSNSEFHTGSVEDGTVISRVTFDAPAPNVKCKINGTFTIGVCHAPNPRGQDRSVIIGLAELLCTEVEEVITELFQYL